MTQEEIRARFDAVAELRARFTEAQLFVRGLLERHGVQRVEDLPQAWIEIIDVRAAGLLTPEQVGAELSALNREVESLAVVRELHKLYGLEDTRA
jgi:hypothetical protein